MSLRRRLLTFVLGAAMAVAAPLAIEIPTAHAAEVAKGDLAIVGLGLEVDRNPVSAAADVPSYVQTIFGGLTDDAAPVAEGISALGDLTGPGIDAPITLSTMPGHKFAIPALHEKGEYTLQNIRLVGADGQFLQQAVPSFATIEVTSVLETKVRVRQLTAEELRERGIHVDSTNYDVYEYTFVFGVEGSTIEVPYSVIIDKRTREIIPVQPGGQTPPPLQQNSAPPRFSPPMSYVLDLGDGGPDLGQDPKAREDKVAPPTIPAALVLPNGFGVLHQFFAVILDVSNAAADGSDVRIDSISASFHSPQQLRVSKVVPAVSIGQPVPIVDEETGAHFLVAGARGSAEWTVEALKAGTHTVDIDVRAVYQKPGQDDYPLSGHVAASIVVNDPRFQINFSHPDTVRKDQTYTAYAFVTNLSGQRQHVILDTSSIPDCSSGGAIENICRVEGSGVLETDIEPGQMIPVPYKLTSRITGKVFAAAGSANDETLGVSVQLTMGVSESGIPLSPATLILPYYAQFLPGDFVDANMQLLGLGYSLATAPLNKYTAQLPRVIQTDVFTRAQQIARAGQRIFITRAQRDVDDPAEDREALDHLALDLLGNVERVDQQAVTPELVEWDELRRSEDSGRIAAAAMARQLERVAGAATPTGFVDGFASATSHRSPFLMAYAHGAPVDGVTRPYALSVIGQTTGAILDVPAESSSGWKRLLPYGEANRFTIGGDAGELAMVGRWKENVRIVVKPAASSFTINVLYPDADDGTMLRADIDVTGATPGAPVAVNLSRGSRTLIVENATGVPLVDAIPQTALAVAGAAQDLHLEAGGHIVTLLFNRPVGIALGARLRDLLSLTINVPAAAYTSTRRNDPLDPTAELQIPGAALQEDGRILAITFDKALSQNAQYAIGLESILDLIGGASFSASDVVPRIDNDRPGAILTGRVLLGDNTPVPNVLVQLEMPNIPIGDSGRKGSLIQYDVADADGRYMFEFVPRDIDAGILGQYNLRAETADGKQAQLSGAVRLPGVVHTVNLVFGGIGTVQGHVRYDDGEPLRGRYVTLSSLLHSGYIYAFTDDDGYYEAKDVPIAPLTFSVQDERGRIVYATGQLRTPGEVLTKDLVILRSAPTGTGTVRIVVRRSDTNEVVPGAQVGVATQGYALQDGLADVNGSATFSNVPAGLVSILAADFTISRESVAVELDLHADQTIEQTLVIPVANAQTEYATLEGDVTRDDPASPGDASLAQPVSGAVVAISGIPPVNANADGSYSYPDLPLALSGRTITVFDPATGRKGWFHVPTLVPGSNHLSMKLKSLEPEGKATMRVRLYGAQGEPVSGFRVLVPGYPPERFQDKGVGVYELADIPVPRDDSVVAIPTGSAGAYGDQYATGRVRVDFDGQIGVSDLHLPGSGTIVVQIEVEQPCGTPPCWAQATGPVALTYGYWDEFTQGRTTKTIQLDPDPATGLVTFTKVPARQRVSLATVNHPAGYASQNVELAFDGDARTVTLRLQSIGDVTGRVFAYDGITPVSGATVRLDNGAVAFSPQLTKPDGSFRFAAVPANLDFTVVAELEQNGIYRTGRVSGRTPQGGGPVSNLIVTMREQSSVEGRVVDGGGAAVPLAHYWLRELSWPYRSIGTPLDPLSADINGRFIVGNVFTGPFRITAVDPGNQEIRGDYQGTLNGEGDTSQSDVEVQIGQAGVGSISVTVVDPFLGFAPVENAEVALYRGGTRFDFTSTNENGVAFFEQVPVGVNFHVTGYSKGLGRGGASATFAVVVDETASVSVQLELRGLVTGFMTDPESEPVPDAPVVQMPVTLSGSAVLRDSTDENGAFEIDGVPEGPFTISGWEVGTERVAPGPPGLFISKLVPEVHDIHLELERTATLTVRVYLPNDTGGPGELVPLADIDTCQCNKPLGLFAYERELQSNPSSFPKMLHGWPYTIKVRELGGESRTVTIDGSFPPGVYEKTETIVLPQSGTVEVLVLDGAGNPVKDAAVKISGRSGGYDLFTPADGTVRVSGVPFGWKSVTASKGNVTAAGGGDLQSRSQPLHITLNLGTNIAVQGFVDAEQGLGEPSVGTRVLVNVSSNLLPNVLRLETLTTSDGSYTFSGIPVGGTTLSFLYYGLDDTTIGATQTVNIPDGSTGTIVLPHVKLDATPPRVVSIDPPANSTNVSPSTSVTVTFSEPIAAAYLTTQWFHLVATSDNSTVQGTIQASVRPDGTYVVQLMPPPPPGGQPFPLKSNVLYRFAIPAGVKDLTGNSMNVAIGTSFTTVDYTEPAIVRIEPTEDVPVVEGQTFRVKFNKAIAPTSFDAGNGGVATLERLDSYKGTAVESIPVTRFVDPTDSSTLVVSPTGVAIAESSFYRLTVAGARDTQTPPNVQRDPRVFEFFSFDHVKPVVAILSPLTDGESLISGVLYTVTVAVTNEGTTDQAGDVGYVDWFDEGGASIARAKTSPYGYTFVAPTTTTGTTFTLKASATDLSFNTSDVSSRTWNVAPNEPPANIAVANTPDSAYPTKAVQTRVSFEDEGLTATVALAFEGTKTDGTELHQTLGSKNVTRASTSVPFPESIFDWTIPLVAKDGTASVVATVTDSVSKSGTGQAAVTVLADQTPPELVSFLPKSESRFQFGVNGTYTIELKVKDVETGIARAVINVNGTDVLDATSGSYDPATGVTTFTKAISVPPKNADTRVPIVVTIYDNRDNVLTDTHEVIYERVDDSTLPRAAWITPLDGAALPSNQSGWSTTLRVQATDDQLVTSVRFESTALAAPITLTSPKSGTTDIFETAAALTMPADGSLFTITAIVADGDPAHDVELPITIDPVAVSPSITGDINISSITASQYENKSVLIRGPVKVYITVPLTLADLILVDGAVLGNPEEIPLDLTIADRLFVDADSRIDVTDKGYLGGLRRREDNTFTNPSRSGRTLGGTPTGGAANADASYGGIGGSSYGATNATYGSIVEPIDLGSGGGGEPGGSHAGANGGGAILLRGGSGLSRFVVAGAIRADGGSASGSLWAAGAGGSVNLRSRALITGPATRITANGGDEGGSTEVDRGAGGGRVAVRVSERFDADADADAELPIIQTRGGRNGQISGGGEGAQYVDGGAGTIYLARPDAALGELILSTTDERHPTTTHAVAGTPLAGPFDYDAITIGARVLARFDDDPAGAYVADPSALVLTPADVPSVTLVSTTPDAGADVAQSTSITSHYTAASSAGIREVRTILDVQPNDVVAYPRFATDLAETPSTIAIPATAASGATSLKVRVTDRAGRVAESAPVAFNIVDNAAPVIVAFDVTPPVETYAGHAIAVSAAASDDVAVTSLSLASTVGAVTSQPPVQPTPTTMTRAFSVGIPPTTPSGTNVDLTLSASDGFPGRTPTTQTKSVAILADSLPPALTIGQPAANAELQEGTGVTFVVEATASDAEVAVQRVTVTLDGVEHEMSLVSGDLYRATLDVPNVEGSDPVAKTLIVKALDYESNLASVDRTIYIRPLIDPNAPALQWVCTSPGAMYPVGYEITLRISVVPSSGANGVQSVEVSVAGGAPIPATSVGTNLYEAKYTIPPGTADGTMLDVRVVANSVGGNQSTLLGTITAVAGIAVNTASTIAATDFAFENQSIIVGTGGVLTIIGPHALRNLVVLSGGKLVQKHVDINNADLLTVERLFVGCGGTIDVSGLGYPPHTTYPGERVAATNGASSHIGRGGWRADSGSTYGSIYRPREAGAGEFNHAVGGGVVRVAASSATIDGTIHATGQSNTSSFQGGAAGGSVWIAADSIHGAGLIEADGGNGAAYSSTNAGGGAIAIEYTDAASILPTLQAKSGDHYNPYGGAGSLYTRGPQSTYGDLRFDNSGRTVEAFKVPAMLPALGTAVVESVPDPGTIVLAAPASIQPYFAGHWLRIEAPDGTIRGFRRIASVTSPTELALEGGSVEVLPGDTVRGAYRLDSLTLVNAWVETPDLVLVETPPVLDATSRLYTGNEGAPVVDPSKISLAMGTYGPLVIGQPGAVTDPDQPIDVSLRNTNRPSDVPTHANAVADGSFTRGVDGAPGDPIRLTARDSHHYPLESDVSLGSIPNDIGIASLTFDPPTVTGGRSVLGTVTMSSPAGADGAVVGLQSDSASVSVPSTLTIPAGQLSATFSVMTSGVTTATNVSIAATWGGNETVGHLPLLPDEIPPDVTITQPAANAEFTEGAGSIAVEATIVDDDSGVKSATATIGGNSYALTKDAAANVWTGSIPIPFVDGTDNVTMDLTVTALDNVDNLGTSAPLPLVIKPVIDANPPTLTWNCFSDGGMYAVGDAVALRVTAIPPNGTNTIQKVELLITAPDGTITPYAASALGNDEYQYLFTIPGVADGASFEVRALATTVSGTTAEVTRSFIAVANAIKVTTTTTIAAGDATYEGKSVVITAGTTTIAGAHSFKRLIVYSGANVTHATGDKLNVQAEDVFVACGGSIDASGKGYTGTATYPGEQGAGHLTGGSHMGRGGLFDGPYGSTFGSVDRPQEGGAASGSCCGGSASGGGVVRIEATAVVVDGAIRANGAGGGNGSGAGGSVWITATRINGGGSIASDGGSANYGIGGGGAISIDYTDLASVLPTLSSRTGTNTGQSRYGGAGTIYVKGPGSTYGDLTIDNEGLSSQPTILPSFGQGTAQAGTSGATLVTDRATDIPAYFVGHWVEIYGPDGTLKGTWRIATIDGAKRVTLEGESGEIVSLEVGDRWQGVYRFDNMRAVGIRVESADPIRVGGTQTIEGTVETEQITTSTLDVKGTLTHATGQSLTVKADEVRVEAGGTIDVSGRGYTNTATYPAEVVAGDATGGSHIGRGGLYNGPYGSTYGSVYRPQEKGAASGSCCNGSGPGGGVVRIEATNVVVDGAIRANGQQSDRSGAGGSVWITTSRITGGGAIETNGGNSYYGIGGGGAVSIEYTDPTSVLPALTSRTGTNYGQSRYGGAGSIYVKGAGSTYGDLTIDNKGLSSQPTILPSFGQGTAQAGTSGATLVTDRATDILAYFVGHWVEIYGPDGTLKGTWRIATIDGAKRVTLEGESGEIVSLEVGDRWQGVYRFDNMRAVGIRVESADPIRVGGTQTIEGTVETERITTSTLDVKGTLTHATGQSLTVKADEVRVEAGGAIDVSGRGYTNTATYPSEVVAGDATGGSHIGRGGLYNGPYGSTYGSVYRPQEKGAASGSCCNGSGPGGGAVRIEATNVVVDGAIRANGQQSDRSGAGGSVWITTSRITGAGAIETNGGNSYYGIGGGGAVSIEYTDPTSTLPTLTSRSGTNYGQSRYGGAGSIYVKGTGSTYGDLTIDNKGINKEPTILPSLGAGFAQSGSGGTIIVTDRATDIPPYFIGHWIEIHYPSGTLKGTYRIAAVNGKSFTLDDDLASVVEGDQWQGVYRFDHATLRTTTVISGDPWRVTAPIDQGSTSLLINEGPPQFSAATRPQIQVESLPGGDFVVGPAGAVTDPDKPIHLTATNMRTNATFNLDAAADGSFRIPVSGDVGDAFILRATDSHTAPLSTTVAVNGAIASLNEIATLTLQQSKVTGGSMVTGSVRMLYRVVRASEGVVALSSSDSAATVPGTISIPVGASSGSFQIATTSVASDTSVTITASANGTSQQTTLALLASNALAAVTVDPPSVEGGSTVNGTVTLGAAAPAGGATISLFSSNTSLVAAPLSVLIPSGSLVATFSITTSRVAADTSATITAIYGDSKSAMVELTKCAALGTVPPPESLSLGTTWIDDSLPAGSSQSGDAVIDSTQAASGASSIHMSGATPGTRTFSMTTTTPLTVGPGDSLVAYLLVNPCDPPRQIMVDWKGNGVDYRATWGENRIDPIASPSVRIDSMPAGGAWTRLEVPAKRLGINGAIPMTMLQIQAVDGEAWVDAVGTSTCSLQPNLPAPTSFPSTDSVWVDDDTPPGVTIRNDTNNSAVWTWDTTQSASGTRSHVEPLASGYHQHYYYNDPNPIAIEPGDVLYAYVLIDPCNPPREIMLQWNDGSSWDHRAYWGEDLINAPRFRVGAMPERGRWVRLEVPASNVGLNERKVYGAVFALFDGRAWFDRSGKLGRVNLALGKPAQQSTSLAGSPASLAVDGNVTSATGAMSITTNGSEQWWEVDLGSVYPMIQTIEIRGRTDCCTNQTSNITAFVSDTPITAPNLTTARGLSGVGIYRSPGTVGSTYSIEVGRSGRYVRLWRGGTDYLTLPEVFVWAPAGEARVNIAAGRPAYAPPSVQYLAYYPEHAVNGHATDTYNTVGGIFHTTGALDSYWQVDLGKSQPISSIDISARTDCCPEQLTGYYVLTSDQPFPSESLAPNLADATVSVWWVGTFTPVARIPVNKTARYVRLQRPGSGTALVFTEVQVWSQQANTILLSLPAKRE